MGSSSDLVILGAGPAGLAAAWRAARRGLSVLLLERAETVGGMAASFGISGIRVDLGSHRLSPDMPEAVLGDLRQLMGADLQVRYRNGRLLIADRWVTYPFKPRELARALPAVPMARAAFDALATSWRRSRAHETADSYADLMRAGFGPTLYRLVYEPYSRKLWGLDGDRIDAEQARRKAGAPSAFAALVRSVRRTLSTESLSYLYPRQGFGQLCDELADAAVSAGARLRLGAAAEAIETSEMGAVVRLSGVSHWSSYADGDDEVRAGHVFSTLPLPVLARIVRPGAPYEAVNASGALRFRAMLLVYVVHSGGRWTKYDVHYVPDGGTPVTRISEPANHRVSLDDPDDRTVVCFEVPCEVGDDLWNASDGELEALINDAVGRCRLPPLNLEWLQVKRLRQVYPIYHKGYQAQLDALESWADTVPHVTTFGRLGLFSSDNTHHALVMGYQAADALGRHGFDKTAWRAARQSFAHVTET